MLLARSHKFLIVPTAKHSISRMMFWFSLSTTFAALLWFIRVAVSFFSSANMLVQDDARQHVFDAKIFRSVVVAP